MKTNWLYHQCNHTSHRQRVLPPRTVLLLLIGVTALAGLLRAIRLDGKGLWLDEAFSIWISSHRLDELWRWLVQIDQHPPVYYLALHSWMRILGQAPGTVRSLSVLVSTCTAPVVYALGRRVSGTRAGLFAALLFAISPFHVQFAQEARMYALLTLAVSLAALALLRLLADPNSAALPIGAQVIHFVRTWRATGQKPALSPMRTDFSWAVYILSSATALLTHHTAFLAWLASNLSVLTLTAWQRAVARPAPIQRDFSDANPSHVLPAQNPGQPSAAVWRSPSLHNWFVAQGLVLILWIPWLKPFIVQASGVYRRFWIPSPTWQIVLQAVGNLVNAFMPHQIRWAGVIWALYALLTALGIYGLRKRPARLAFLAILFATPFLGELLISVRRPIFYDRTLIWASIPLIIWIALGLEQLRYPSVAFTACAMLVTVQLLSQRSYHVDWDKEQWDLAAPYVAHRAQENDLLLFNASWVQIPFDLYFEPQASVQERGVPVDLFDRGVLEPRMTADDIPQLKQMIRDRQRVWLIYSHQWYTDPDQIVPQTIQQSMDLVQRRRFVGLEVRLYQQRAKNAE